MAIRLALSAAPLPVRGHGSREARHHSAVAPDWFPVVLLHTVTAHPTAEWIAQQITEAFPWNEVPSHLVRDRDRCYGRAVIRRIGAMGIRDHPIAPRSLWQNGYAERLIGSIRRECLDHIVVWGEEHLRRILAAYADHYNSVRPLLSLAKDSPHHRPIQRCGPIVSAPTFGGLHHHYCRT